MMTFSGRCAVSDPPGRGRDSESGLFVFSDIPKLKGIARGSALGHYQKLREPAIKGVSLGFGRFIPKTGSPGTTRED
jgi:hypothetical protein